MKPRILNPRVLFGALANAVLLTTSKVAGRRPKLRSVARIVAAIVLLIAWTASRGEAQVRINVLTTQQGNSSNLPAGQRCSLQEAIYSAEFGRNAAIGSTSPDTTYGTDCVAGTGLGDTIVLTGETYTFHTLWDGDAHNPFGPTATPIIFKKIIIEGHGSTLQSDQSGYFRLFAVGEVSMTIAIGTTTTTYSGTGDLTLQNVHITGFHVKGGNGARGGGGGLGAGGAIYVGKVSTGVASLTIENSTFDNNGAMGGNGASSGIGGGGGLGGNGGSDIYPNLGGGGGGGARGNGGAGGTNPCNSFDCSGGGGGGGTVFSGANGVNDPNAYGPGAGGFDCGGGGGGPADFHDGGYITNTNGHDGTCHGGGGGGGAVYTLGITGDVYGHGGDGMYGGGGGGSAEDAGNGGFGGGGGGGISNGGNGGFGGGGGAANGHAGTFGGNASTDGGGGGGALGGAIFIDYGTTVIQNSTFNNNAVLRGLGAEGADNGGDSGGAIFARDGSLTIQNSTISGNAASGAGGGVKILNDVSLLPTVYFALQNTIVANNDAQGCIVTGAVYTDDSTHNLITDNSGCPAATVTTDPQLSALSPNAPGDTPTMAINPASSAYDAGDDSKALATDQRGVERPQGSHSDIGAYEFKPFADLGVTKTVSSSTVQAGDTLTYTVTLTNHGPNAASNVTVTDTFPAELTFVSCSATGIGVCATGGGTITYSTLDVDLPETITLTGTMNSGYARGILVMNIASVSGSPDDPVSGNNTASVSSTVIVPDFSITAGTPVTIPVGGSASSTISVASLDGFNSAVGLTASGPSGFGNSFNPASVTPPANSSTTSTLTMSLQPSVVPGPYTVNVTGTSGSLTHSASVSVTVQVTLDAVANVINADVTSGAIDNAGIGTALTSKLTAAKSAMIAGQTLVEINTLQALLNEIGAQTGKHIRTSFADGSGQTFNPAAVLVTDVSALVLSAGANVVADPIMGSVLNGNGSAVSGATVNLLNSANAVVASATTDAAGFYYFPATAGFTSGATYTVKFASKGFGTAKPSSQAFTWSGTAVSLKNFVVN